ncbi:flavin-containing monooxygenase [Pseudoneobacillus sp. C159]
MIYDAIIIGAGQAGLSLGYFLKKSSLNFLILDNHTRVGDVWRNRYDSLVLFTPRSYSSLPGLAMEGDQEVFPTKDEVADYLESYANKFGLPVIGNMEVLKVSRKDQFFQIQTRDALFVAKKVVVATGPFHTSRIPAFSKNLSSDVIQLHSSEYLNPAQLNDGPVLVVGGGNSGTQIAVELSETHETYLALGQDIRFLPLSIVGKSIFWWLDRLGILKANRNSLVGKKFMAMGDPIFGYELKGKIKSGKVELKSRAVSGLGEEVSFDNQSSLTIKNVIWATGFRSEYPWLELDGVWDMNGRVKHERGITDIEGLYFLGLPWQYRRGSALLLGVGVDAEYLYKQIIKGS